MKHLTNSQILKSILFIILALCTIGFVTTAFGQDTLSNTDQALVNDVVSYSIQRWPIAAKIVGLIALLSEMMALIPNEYYKANGVLDTVWKLFRAIFKAGKKNIPPTSVIIGGVFLFGFSINASAQSFSDFTKPVPKVKTEQYGRFRFNLLAQSTQPDSFTNQVRPIANLITYAEPGHIALAGAGVSYQHLKWDYVAAKWNAQYSFSALVYGGGQIAPPNSTIIAMGGQFGILNNMINFGAGYNFISHGPLYTFSLDISLNN